MEKRQELRTQYPCRLLIHHPIWGQRTAVCQDISDSGVFVSLESETDSNLAVGSTVSVSVITGLPEPKSLTTQVVRADKQGLGLKFIA